MQTRPPSELGKVKAVRKRSGSATSVISLPVQVGPVAATPTLGKELSYSEALTVPQSGFELMILKPYAELFCHEGRPPCFVFWLIMNSGRGNLYSDSLGHGWFTVHL